MKKIAENLRWVMMIALGCAVFALGFDLFLEPNGLSAGGISGIALIVIHLAPITTVGIATAMMNFPLFFFGGKKIGLRFFVGSIIGTVFFSFFTQDLTAQITAMTCTTSGIKPRIPHTPVPPNSSRSHAANTKMSSAAYPVTRIPGKQSTNDTALAATICPSARTGIAGIPGTPGIPGAIRPCPCGIDRPH